MWVWIPVLSCIIAIYMISYILVRTSGDGRPALVRLRHPTKGGLQPEYGGDGQGRDRSVAAEHPPENNSGSSGMNVGPRA
jgi:hypothetical protein